MKKWVSVLATTALTLAVSGTAVPTFAAQSDSKTLATAPTLENAFAAAAKEFNVPKELLMAVSYTESRWQMDTELDASEHGNGKGLMHLSDNSFKKALSDAAKQLGVKAKDLESDPTLNIRGGAFVLAKAQKDLGKSLTSNLNDWYEAVASFEGASQKQEGVLFADEVFRVLKEGTSLTIEGGTLSVAGDKTLAPNKGAYTNVEYGLTSVTTLTPDYSGAIWNPASTSNYQVATRPTSNPINYVIIHDTEGSYSGSINWFKDPAAQVSAHYVVRSSDGQITQMVQEKDIAWHARSFNTNGIGVEHEGYEAQTGWYTDAMYTTSAALVKSICQRYGIPMDREHILSHSELWGNDHTDPGKNWDWNKYMTKITGVSKNWTVVNVDDQDTASGAFTFSGPSQYWHPITGYGLHNEINYTNGNGTVISNYATWKPTIPVAGNYEVKVFIPSNYAATTGAKYEIHYNGGVVTKTVNQSLYSNQWVSLGTYNFATGTAGYVKLGDNTGDKVSIGFDTIRFIGQ
ncbi:N-acetylmuramoyl-L-alanine amidase [Tumebacillus sp. ITR2]|uniref:N-acetylmuramoyl-L-alanine amidase n=1 Tax=Tumebacillus amylolyticus TaxID=2801339 RepID=A0ABS1J8C4_9BACL|nr:N-acetylmuramoyl-L-alanine amidase [Tumebacillus amylolyticus]MBL0386523.1 N-acetylmuramoyl-L-alanine amidase [Tumebacillus amylolyticus]